MNGPILASVEDIIDHKLLLLALLPPTLNNTFSCLFIFFRSVTRLYRPAKIDNKKITK